VVWMGQQEAAVYLVVRAGDDQASVTPTLVQDAEAKVREWVTEAGLSQPGPDGYALECQASARA
jgi:hypothetical protein